LASILKERDRKVVPRWRTSGVTLATGELGSTTAPHERQSRDDASFTAKRREWRYNKSVPLATDIVGSAFVLGREKEGVEAARFIVTNAEHASRIAQDLARRILHPYLLEPSPGNHIERPEENNIRRRIHIIRLRLHDQPRNALLWTDLALQYTLLDEREKAKKAMKLALSIAPHNRHVLRAAARLYVHFDNYLHANWIVRTAPIVSRDPWVLATEIVTATIAGRDSRFVKTGFRLLEDLSLTTRHVTELASALATLEFAHGNHRASRKLFRRALGSPNENSLAQVRWAAKRLGGLDIEEAHVHVPLAFEADAIKAFQERDLETAFHKTKVWLYDQPFSLQPSHLACFLSSVALEEYGETLRIVALSERSNPNNRDLQYHKVFALASLNRLDEAQDELDKAINAGGETRHEILALADQGLILYRRGAPQIGKDYYREALAKAEGKAFEGMRAMAAIYYAREELLAGSPNAEDALKLAHKVAEGVSVGSVDVAFDRLRGLEKECGKEPEMKSMDRSALSRP
jgi:tetratricopeptide (TPR) repeat protein